MVAEVASIHSIYFSKEAKKDVAWWLAALREFKGKSPIPPSIWTPLALFHTDASLDGFGIVWGSRRMAGLFLLELEMLDITKKEMVTVMAAVKHWFADLAGLKVLIYVDNQVCVAHCSREIHFILVNHNIALKAQYI